MNLSSLPTPRHLALVLCGLISLGGSTLAQAHQIWLEQDAKGAALYFGEFRLNLHEDSPGILDKLAKPTALLLTKMGPEPIKMEKKTTEYVLASRAAPGQALIVEDLSYPVREARGELGLNGKMLWRPAARLVTDLSAQKPKLKLDVVPTGEPGKFSVYWDGAVRPGAKIEVISQSGWSQEISANPDGIAEVPMPWRGRYVLLTHHTEMTPGTQDGKPYDFITYTSTLSVEQAKGVASLPIPPLAKPSM